MSSPTSPSVPGWAGYLWRVSVSPVTFVVLSLLWCLDLAVGSILAYRADPRFWVKMDAVPFNVWLREAAPDTWPQSLWVYILVGLTYLVVASLLLCTANWFFRKRLRMRGMGEVLVHLGFLLIFSGFVLGSGFGSRTQGVVVPAGGAAPVGQTGLTLRVDEVSPVQGPGGRAWDTVSTVALLRAGEAVARGTVKTNQPLIWGSTVVYPQGSQSRVAGARVATTAGTVTLRPGSGTDLGRGRTLSIGGVLAPGERWGPYFGPGVLVELHDADNRKRGSVFLTPAMRGLAELGDLRLRLVDLELEATGVYDVHRDPGILLVLVGAVALTAGTWWALIGYLGVWRQPTTPGLAGGEV